MPEAGKQANSVAEQEAEEGERRERGRLSEEVQNLHQELVALKEQGSRAKDDLKQCRDNTLSAQKEGKEARAAVQKQTRELKLLQQQTADAASQHCKLCKAISQMREGLQALVEKHSKLSEEVRAAETLRQRIAAELAASKPLTGEMSKTKASLSALQAQSAALEQEIANKKETTEAEQKLRASLTAEVAERESHKADLALEFQKMEDSLAKKNEQLSQLNIDLASAEASKRILTDEVEMLRDFMSRECAIMEQKDSLAHEIEALQAQKDQLSKENIETEAAIAKHRSQGMTEAASAIKNQAELVLTA